MKVMEWKRKLMQFIHMRISKCPLSSYLHKHLTLPVFWFSPQKSFWVIFTNKILPYTLANKIKKKDVPLGVIHISSNPHQLTNHIIPNRIMGSRCDYAKNQKWLHQAMLRFQVYFDVFLLVLSFQFSKSESCFRLIQIFQN